MPRRVRHASRASTRGAGAASRGPGRGAGASENLPGMVSGCVASSLASSQAGRWPSCRPRAPVVATRRWLASSSPIQITGMPPTRKRWARNARSARRFRGFAPGRQTARDGRAMIRRSRVRVRLETRPSPGAGNRRSTSRTGASVASPVRPPLGVASSMANPMSSWQRSSDPGAVVGVGG